MIAYLRLLRAGTLFSPAADVLAGACLIGAAWSVDLVRGMLASVFVYAAGMVLNDHADLEVDRIQRPERPIPKGQISKTTALLLGLGLLGAGIGIAPWPLFHAVLAALVLGYDYLFKKSPIGGALTMGLLRGLNLVSGAALATIELPDERLVWIAAGVYAAYIVSVTILGIYEDEKQVTPRAVASVQTIPALFVPLMILSLPHPWPAAAIAIVLAVVFGRRVRTTTEWTQAEIRRSMMWLLLGTMVYTSLLCLGSGRPLEALGISLAILPARWIARTIALT